MDIFKYVDEVVDYYETDVYKRQAFDISAHKKAGWKTHPAFFRSRN